MRQVESDFSGFRPQNQSAFRQWQDRRAKRISPFLAFEAGARLFSILPIFTEIVGVEISFTIYSLTTKIVVGKIFYRFTAQSSLRLMAGFLSALLTIRLCLVSRNGERHV
ncbi:MAG: hypothetical protein R2788_06935 [Saprospiraceae bacterium]